MESTGRTLLFKKVITARHMLDEVCFDGAESEKLFVTSKTDCSWALRCSHSPAVGYLHGMLLSGKYKWQSNWSSFLASCRARVHCTLEIHKGMTNKELFITVVPADLKKSATPHVAQDGAAAVQADPDSQVALEDPKLVKLTLKMRGCEFTPRLVPVSVMPRMVEAAKNVHEAKGANDAIDDEFKFEDPNLERDVHDPVQVPVR